ncbi:hypothetical protein [Brachybacterium hainanense]|uniref:Uncharacterized protein n=1 Tax=Brachybacterium hainanense TaxID=1541174 RepID=A0ABV6R621_9MICO
MESLGLNGWEVIPLLLTVGLPVLATGGILWIAVQLTRMARRRKQD